MSIETYLSVRQFRLTDISDLLSWIKFSKNIWFNEKQSIYVLDSALNSEKLKELSV